MAGAIVQSRFTDGGGVTTLPLAFAVNNTAGNFLVAFCAFGSGSGATLAVSDSANGSYGAARKNVSDVVDNNTGAVFVLGPCVGGANTVTFTWGGAASNTGICIAEVSGVSAFDVAQGRQQTLPGTGANLVGTGTATSTQIAMMLGLAWATSSALTPAAGSGFTSTAAGNVNVLNWSANLGSGTNVARLEWQASMAAGLNQATFTDPSGGDWVTLMVMLDEASASVSHLTLLGAG